LRQFALGIAVALVAAVALAHPVESNAEPASQIAAAGAAAAVPAHALEERALGKDDAPVTIIEYASLTCPHCAAFAVETLPKIEKAYIDTGKARLIFRDFPFDRVGLKAAALARCVDPGRYFGFLEVLFRDQANWARERDPVAAVTRLARFAGLDEDSAAACLDDKELLDTLIQRRVDAEQEFKVNSTPSFIINGTKVVGNQPFSEFEKVIDQALQ
jgi:protein-disulfide isomerase